MKKITYTASEGLQAAVQVARDLEMPLLVTGEPGTGKTQLAYWVATELLKGKEEDVLRFNTKTTSVAKDLFYRYDAIRHFRDASRDKLDAVKVLDYITFEALGKAILAAGERQYVVLIDEIDKAPRDFPNDVLFEFEDMAFRVEEALPRDFVGYDFSEKPEFQELKANIGTVQPKQGAIRLPENAPKPLLILTSNSEKNLPDAFLRRCVFYHIAFPDKDALAKIVRENAQLSPAYLDMVETMVKKFEEIRNKGLRKLPATAELVRWAEILEKRGVDLDKGAAGDADMNKLLLGTYPVLAKNREDLNKMS
ncbi:MAG: MoxR family ATPase [Saprospiraceae bacterium]|nr:MoxR family ATPase [Saprospiraceae bacterium]